MNCFHFGLGLVRIRPIRPASVVASSQVATTTDAGVLLGDRHICTNLHGYPVAGGRRPLGQG